MIVGEKHYICIVMNINRLSKSVIIKTYYDMKFKICLFLLSISFLFSCNQEHLSTYNFDEKYFSSKMIHTYIYQKSIQQDFLKSGTEKRRLILYCRH